MMMVNRPILLSVCSLLLAFVCFIAFNRYPHVAVIPYFAAIFALFPYYLSIYQALIKKQLDLSLPPIITIYLLLFLRKGNIALIFILIIILGHLFKTFILERVKSSITTISEKLPKTANIRLLGKIIEIEIKNIKVGDLLFVKSGERVATDAQLLTEEALLDESVITGESKPIQKRKGDKLIAGSINAGDYLEAKAISTAQNSTLFQIQRLVFQAQNEKAPLAHIVSKYAWITTILAFVGVMLIYLVTHNILKALSFWIAVVPVIFAFRQKRRTSSNRRTATYRGGIT